MKHLFTFFLFVSSTCLVSAQVETKYYELPQRSSAITKSQELAQKDIVQRMPSFDVNEMIQEDSILAGMADVPYRFGKDFALDITLDDGVWHPLDSGRVWTMTFESVGALSLNFIFDDFFLPDGASLEIINANANAIYGPVKAEAIPKNGHFMTDLIPDDKVTIFLYEPLDQYAKSTLKISHLIHAYRGFDLEMSSKGIGSSSNCNVDVACHPEYSNEAKGVALVLLANGDEWCSGSLLMSTDMLFKPYFLTAFHCIDTNFDGSLSTSEKTNAQNWMFKFNFKRATCGGDSIMTSYTYNGSIFRSAFCPTDFALLEINQNLTSNSNLAWLGWDRSGDIPLCGVGIHHPAGDVMKISIEDDAFTTIKWVGVNSSGNFDHWGVDYDEGIVEGGSSGSPLLNQNRRVVGQLHGTYQNNNRCLQTYAIYGKFNLSWSGAGTNDTRLSNWLDPAGTGVTVMPSSFDFTISGQGYIYNEACTYSIFNLSFLPSTMSVNWSLTGDNASNFVLESNTPATNQCRITRISDAEFDGSANLTLSAQIMNGSTTIYTTSMQLTAPYIVGPTIPCGHTVYHVDPLPDNYTLEWAASGRNLGYDTDPNGLLPGYPYAYVIIHEDNEVHQGTLTATIKNGNTIKGTLQKNVDTTDGFSGTWYQQATLTDTVNSTPSPFRHNSFLTFIPNRKVYLQSEHFVGASITHTQSNLLLGNWSHNGSTISFTPHQVTSSPSTMRIIGTDFSGCKRFQLNLSTPVVIPPILLSMRANGNLYEFTLSREDVSEQAKSENTAEWHLTIMKIDTGKRYFDEAVRATTKSISTSGWPSGIYAAVAQYDNQTYSLKFSVGE